MWILHYGRFEVFQLVHVVQCECVVCMNVKIHDMREENVTIWNEIRIDNIHSIELLDIREGMTL